jgi:hypothetical protein
MFTTSLSILRLSACGGADTLVGWGGATGAAAAGAGWPGFGFTASSRFHMWSSAWLGDTGPATRLQVSGWGH